MNPNRIIALLLLTNTVSLASVGYLLEPPSFMPPGGLVRSPALVKATNLNPSGAIFYTFDGSDPREHFGGVVTNAQRYSALISVNRSMIIRARVKSGTNWSALVAAPYTADQDFSQLLFTEVMYQPRDKDDFEEFVELKNVGAVPLDLSGLEFAGTNSNMLGDPSAFFAFSNNTIIAPGTFFVLARDADAFRASYPSVRFDGQYIDDLANDFDYLVIRGTNGAQAARMLYNSHHPWPLVPDNHGYFPNDGIGFSMVRANLNPAADPERHSSWRVSAYRHGSPGADDPEPVVPQIYVNELLARPGSGLRDSVELFNPNPTNVHIGGWWLSDERNDPSGYRIPVGTFVPAFGFVELDDTQFGDGTNGFGFSAEADSCYLFSGDTNGILTGYSHGFGFEGSDRDVTFGRVVATDGTEDFPQQVTHTLGGSNSGPRLSPVVISEVMYHPDGTNAEYVEICNVTAAPVQLWDSQNQTSTWGIGQRSQPREVFPTNTIIPAHGHALFVRGDTNAFWDAHDVPSDVPIFLLPFSLSEAWRGITVIELFRPSGLININTPRYVEVDRVAYGARFPWPPGADGSGYSLERINLTAFGNDSSNWRACPAVSSPGRPNSTNLPPLVWAGGVQTKFTNRPAFLNAAVSDDHWPGTLLTSFWTQVSGPVDAAVDSSSVANPVATFPQPGHYVLRLTASDGVFTAFDDVTVEVFAAPFEGWRATNFTSSELGDELISGPVADPDGDRLNNIEEYFFGTSARVFDPNRLLQATVVGGYLQLTWTQGANTPDVTATPKRADRIEGPWFEGDGLFARTEVSLNGGLERVTIRSLLSLSNSPQQFLRLELGPTR